MTKPYRVTETKQPDLMMELIAASVKLAPGNTMSYYIDFYLPPESHRLNIQALFTATEGYGLIYSERHEGETRWYQTIPHPNLKGV